MSLLESDDFTYYGKTSSGQAPSSVGQGVRYEDQSSSTEQKGRVKLSEGEQPKISTFSLRKKKDKDGGSDGGRTHKKTKSAGKIQPPDSPKSTRSGPSPNMKSSKKQYSHLLENEDTTDDEEDDTNGSFVLTRGQQAKEKRGSFKSTSGTDTHYDPTITTSSLTTASTNTSNAGKRSSGVFSSFPFNDANNSPAVIRPTATTSGSNIGHTPIIKPPPHANINTTSTGTAANFPVFFTPPQDSSSAFTSTNPTGGGVGSNRVSMDMVLGFDSAFTPAVTSESIPTLIPPPVPAHGNSQKQATPQTTPTHTSKPQQDDEWAVTTELYDKCTSQFKDICGEDRLMSGDKARDFFLKSTLPLNELSKIWKLSDIDNDGSLTLNEFTVAMKLVLMRRKNHEIPSILPSQLKVPPPSSLNESATPSFNFPPPPPPKSHAQSHAQVSSTATTLLNPTESAPPIPPSLPSFLNNSKTEPTTAISEVQPSTIDHAPSSSDNLPHPPSSTSMGDISDILSSGFLTQDPLLLEGINISIDSSLSEPAVNRLLSSLGGGEESAGDDDDTSNLVSSGEHPVPKPRKKKKPPQPANTELHRSKTVHGGRGAHVPPPRPPPYIKKSVSPPPTTQINELDSSITTTPSPLLDSDLLPITASPVPLIPPKPAPSTHRMSLIDDDVHEKGHGRSTSWDLTKMLKEGGDLRFHDDVPAAEPPKIPPRHRKDEEGYRSDEEDGRRVDKLATPLQRSASTGSLASLGIPTTIPIKSRTSSIESGTLLVDSSATSISGRGRNIIPGKPLQEEPLQRTSTINRRPAPAPPPNKPKKPMYPPSFKKVVIDSPTKETGGLLAGDQLSEDSLQSSEVYQKKSKSELQKSIKRLKEENTMYTNLNNELTKKLNEMKQQRFRLEAQLNNQSKPF